MIHKTTRSILSVLLAALLLVTSIPLTPAFAGGGGGVSLQSESGESEGLEPAADGKYYISTAEQLKEFADKVNDDSGEYTDIDAVLTDDIDLSSVCGESNSWTPIGTSEENAYTGTFDGNGNTISGLCIGTTTNNQGLFGRVGTGGKVQNLSVSGTVNSSGGMYVGGIAGQNNGNVEDCDFTGSVSGKISVGGVVGYNRGSVENCYNTGSVTNSAGPVGGVVGYSSGDSSASASVTNCYNTGSVSGSYVGGVVGYSSGGFSASASVTNCYNTGTVTGSGNNVGGVVGQNRASVTNCYNIGNVSGNNYVGGVVGDNRGSVENCYNTGAVSGSGWYVGGVVGQNSGNVKNCYNTGSVTGTDSGTSNYVGGVVGYNISSTVENCYNIGEVSGNSYVGGVVGDNSIIGTVTGCYFLKGTAASGIGSGTGSTENVKSLTAEEFAIQSSFTNSSWDFANTWEIKSIFGRPTLRDNAEIGGTANNPYKIFTATQLAAFRDLVNNANDQTADTDAHAKLMNNIDLSSVCSKEKGNWTPIGSDSNRYIGTFNGNGKTISGLYIKSTADYRGLFGYVGTGGTVKDLTVSGTVSGGMYVGGVVGDNRGTVENCHNIGEVSGNRVGGVVGYNNGGTVENCYYQIDKGAIVGIGGTIKDDISQTAAKSLEDFHSGEVAYLLEQKVADSDKPVWGQTLGGEEDSLPTLVALNPGAAQPVYKVTFKYGYDSAPENEISYTNGSVKFPAFERTGYTFAGWTPTGTTISQDTTFTAQWTANTYTVTLDPNDGTIAEDQNVTTYTYGIGATLPTSVTREGYIFAGWYNNADLTGDPVTEISKTDINDKAYWAKWEEVENPEPTPTPTPTPDPTPSGPSTGDSTGWDDIRDELENAENGDEITIDMGDETKVPAEIFESLAGKDVEISFDLGDIQWSVNGADIPTDTDFTDLDLGASLGTSGIPVNVINTITGEVGTVQMTLAHNGEFGFTMTLTAPLGKENAGYWANLYHYDEDAEQLTFETAAEIDADGSVTIPFSHASQYAIVIDTHSHATVDVSDLFIDIAPNAWYKDAIQYAYDNGLMTGVSATEFAPEATTTRAMIVSILARLENVTTAEAAGFADVNDEWYATAVNWAANVGVVNGYEDNTFQPNTAITREQLAAILMNYAAYKGEDVSNRADLTSYTDQPSTWAQEAMQWAVAEKLITGVTNDELQPQSSATRAQVAAILQRFLEA